MNTSLNQQLLALTALLQLEQRARDAHGPELEFLIANETATVVPYQQAALWRMEANGPRLVLSGVATPDPGAPYRLWLNNLLPALTRGEGAREARVVQPAELSPELRESWAEWLPTHALWCPLALPNGGFLGGLLLARADPWSDAERRVLAFLLGAYAQCLALDRAGRTGFRLGWAPRRKLIAVAVIVLIGVVLSLPVRQSVVASAEVTAIDPAPVRAPFEGVVDRVHIAPNAMVKAGDKLVTLDRDQLQTRYDVTERALEMARAEYAVASQQALNDQTAKSRLAVISGKVEQQITELAYARGLLARAEMTAPIDGIAVFDGPADWIGKPVTMGERIMLIASPTRTELEMQVPAQEAVTFEKGAEVVFFSNVAPDRPRRSTLDFASYSSAPTPDGIMAYTFRARFADGPPERLGMKGTAKIYGERQPLAVWLLRRPIAIVRQWLAL